MMKLLSKLKMVLVLVILQIFIYFRISSKNPNSFFFFWGLIYAAFLLYNIFDVKGSSMMGLGGNAQTTYANLSMAYCEKIYEEEASKKSKGYNRIINSTNIILLILLISNIIGYIITT